MVTIEEKSEATVKELFDTFFTKSEQRYSSSIDLLKALKFSRKRFLSVVDKLNENQTQECILHIKKCIEIVLNNKIQDEAIYVDLVKLIEYLIQLNDEKQPNETDRKEKSISEQLKPITPQKVQATLVSASTLVTETTELSEKLIAFKKPEEVRITKSKIIIEKTKNKAVLEPINVDSIQEQPSIEMEIIDDDYSSNRESTSPLKNGSLKQILSKSDSEVSTQIQVERVRSIEEEAKFRKDERALQRIQKVDAFCQKVHQRIIEFEKQDCSMEEMETNHSLYIQESKLKTKFNNAYKKLACLCKKYPHLIELEKMPRRTLGGQFKNRILIKTTRYEEINAKLTKCLNDTRKFPDFVDVHTWVKEANDSAKLNLKAEKLHDIAEEAFNEIGRLLKSRRIKDDKQILKSRVSSIKSPMGSENSSDSIQDPFELDEEFSKKLEENKKIAVENYDKIINEYVKKQEDGEGNLDTEENINDQLGGSDSEKKSHLNRSNKKNGDDEESNENDDEEEDDDEDEEDDNDDDDDDDENDNDEDDEDDDDEAEESQDESIDDEIISPTKYFEKDEIKLKTSQIQATLASNGNSNYLKQRSSLKDENDEQISKNKLEKKSKRTSLTDFDDSVLNKKKKSNEKESLSPKTSSSLKQTLPISPNGARVLKEIDSKSPKIISYESVSLIKSKTEKKISVELEVSNDDCIVLD